MKIKMKPITKKSMLLLLTAVVIFIALYVGLSGYKAPEFEPVTTTTEIGEVEVPEVNENYDVSMIGAYWGKLEAPAHENETCSNETMDLPSFDYIVEANTELRAVSYESCYIKNNGNITNSTVVEMHDSFVALSAKAETDRENDVQACCTFDGEEYCSDIDKLYLCELE